MLEFLIAPSASIFGFQSLGQTFKNLLSIICPFVKEYLFLDSFSDIPVHHGSLRIHIYGNPITGLLYNVTHIIIEFNF